MTIKQNQIVTQPHKSNPALGFPRDLNLTIAETIATTASAPNQAEEVFLIPETETIQTSLPVPVIIAIKSQTIISKPDGTFVVDVVLEVDGVTAEYEVRISKNAG